MNNLAIFFNSNKFILKFLLILFSVITTFSIKTQEKIINYIKNLISVNNFFIINVKDIIQQYISFARDQLHIEFLVINMISGIYKINPCDPITFPFLAEVFHLEILD